MILLILCVVWTILIFILCTMPQANLPKYGIPHMDKIAHFGFFGVQSVLLCMLLRYRTKRGYWGIFFLSTLQVCFYGGLIEVLQSVFYNRTGDIYDLIADTLGGICGAIAYPFFFRIFNKLTKKCT